MIDGISPARRVTVLALLLVAFYRLHLIFIVMGPDQVIGGLAAADGITIAIAVTLLLNVLAIPLALYGRLSGLLLGYLVLVINIVFSGPFLLEVLADPYHFGSWAQSLTILGGNVLGLIFGVIAVIEQLGRELPVWTQKMQGRTLKGSAAAFCGMLLLGFILSLGSAPATELSETPEAVIEIELQDMRFHPQQLQLEKDQPTALFLINRDDYQHAFDVDALDIHVTVPAHSSTIAFVQPTQSGQFPLYCGIPGHEAAGMVGSLTVR